MYLRTVLTAMAVVLMAFSPAVADRLMKMRAYDDGKMAAQRAADTYPPMLMPIKSIPSRAVSSSPGYRSGFRNTGAIRTRDKGRKNVKKKGRSLTY